MRPNAFTFNRRVGASRPGPDRHGPALFSFCLSVGLLIFCTGCPPVKAIRQPYFGDTDSMMKVTDEINRNNVQLPSIWTKLNYTIKVADKNREIAHVVSGDGGLMFLRPDSFYLYGDKEVDRVFELGSNPTEFWLKVAPGEDTYWWGHYANLGKPCCKPIPIRPDLVKEVLGIGLFNSNFLEQPTPVMRFNNDYDCYMFDWNVRAADRWITVKEVWYDRESKNPVVVLLFDENGRVLLSAKLSKHGPVAIEDKPADQQPKIAKHYDLLFTDTGSTMSLDLNDTAINHNKAPKPASFRRPEPDTKKVIQIDEACNDGTDVPRTPPPAD